MTSSFHPPRWAGLPPLPKLGLARGKGRGRHLQLRCCPITSCYLTGLPESTHGSPLSMGCPARKERPSSPPDFSEVRGGTRASDTCCGACTAHPVLPHCARPALSCLRLWGEAPPQSWTPGSPRAAARGPAPASLLARAAWRSWAYKPEITFRGRLGTVHPQHATTPPGGGLPLLCKEMRWTWLRPLGKLKPLVRVTTGRS